MFLDAINYLFGLFSYRWIVDNSPQDSFELDPMDDEGWDDLDNDNLCYKLEKLKQD
ncbi:MAG: hypothetical protein U9N57_03745 [Pseudomonadota bacterium]|nr:hypothetical protein [Pseudomonadota bacterium]